MKILLASGSPRRRELLQQIDVDFDVCPSDADENIGDLPAHELVEQLSLLKACSVASSHEGRFVLGADTVVVSPDGRILGKPKSQLDAVRMLKSLSGRVHTVYTGVSLVRCEDGKVTYEDTRVNATQVFFRTLTDEEIEKYVESGEPMDKAGAYGIQGKASVMISSIEGDYFNVVGLPVCTVYTMLKAAGIKE